LPQHASTRGFPADVPRGFEPIETMARWTRWFLGLAPNEPLDAADIFERIHGRRLEVGKYVVSLETGVGDLPPAIEAQARFLPQLMTIEILLSVATYSQVLSRHARGLFSLCHELGHAVMHPKELMRLSRLPHATAAMLRASADALPAYRDCEWQASAFAAAMIMPAVALERLRVRSGELIVTEVQDRFGASAPAATRRVRDFMNRRERLLAVS
jgi:uncharacterized protein DUF955